MGKHIYERQHKAQVVPFFQDGHYYLKKGLKAYRERNVQKACKLLRRAAELEPEHSTILSQFAIVLTELGDYHESNDILKRILDKVDPDLTECHYFMANNYAHLGLFHEAYKCASLYSEKDPDGEFAADNDDLMDLLTIEGEEEGIGFEGNDDLIMKQDTARSLLESGELEEAIKLLLEITTEYPEFWSAYNNLSLAYFYSGDVEKAKENLEVVLQKNPGNLHAFCNLLVFYYYERQDELVMELVEKLSNVHPILVEHRYKLGATFALVGKYDLAYKWLRSLYKQGFEGDDTFFYWLSYSAYYTNHHDLAKNAWERVLMENPSKKGSEPWNEENAQDRKSIEHRLTLVFLAAQAKRFDEIKEYESLVPQSPVEKSFISLSLSEHPGMTGNDEAAHMFNAAQLLHRHLHSAEENPYLFLFGTMLKARKKQKNLKNYHAWAAAVFYLLEMQHTSRLTKSETAEKFGISVATLTKYERFIKSL